MKQYLKENIELENTGWMVIKKTVIVFTSFLAANGTDVFVYTKVKKGINF